MYTFIYWECVYLHIVIADQNELKEAKDWLTNIQTYT